MRTFRLERVIDVSGVSGTGVVAEGVEFSDGTAVVRWRADGPVKMPTTTVHEHGIDSVRAIHGHSGTTHIVFTSATP